MKMRKDKNEKRRVLLWKKSVKREHRVAMYGTTSGVAIAMSKAGDVNRRFVAAFLALVFALSCLVVGVNFATKADDAVATTTALHPDAIDNSGVHLEKYLTSQADGSYDLTMKAYAKGKTSTTSEQVPTDYVLVIDQSGSMSKQDMPVTYDGGTTKDWKMSNIGNTAYYYKDGDTYYRVFRKRGVMYEYKAPDTVYVGDVVDDSNLSWFQRSATQPQGVASQFYFRPSDVGKTTPANDSSDTNFYPVTIAAAGHTLYYGINFSYTDSSDNVYTFIYPEYPDYKNSLTGRYTKNSTGYSEINGLVTAWTNNRSDYTYGFVEALGVRLYEAGMYVRQPMYVRHVGYSKLCYKDKDGIEHTLIDATYCGPNGEPYGGASSKDVPLPDDKTNTTEATWNGTLYQATTMETRLEALKKAMTQFADTISSQTDKNGPIHHRIAVVGFSKTGIAVGQGTRLSNNTELLTGVKISREQYYSYVGSSDTNKGKAIRNSRVEGTWGRYIVDDNEYKGGFSTPPRTGTDKYIYYWGFDGYQFLADGDTPVKSPLVPYLTDDDYKNALLDVTVEANKSKTIVADGATSGNKQFDGTIYNAIASITAFGATKPAHGFNMAKKILESRGDSAYYTDPDTGEQKKRNTAIIFFTDGQPGAWSTTETGDEYAEANEVVEAAYKIKSDPELSDTQIFSIGLFGQSDGDPLTYPTGQTTSSASTVTVQDYDPRYAGRFDGNTSTNDILFRECVEGQPGYPDQSNDTIGDYMSVVSSEYPEAQKFTGTSLTGTSPNQTRTFTESSYTEMIQNVRGPKSNSRYYYISTSGTDLNRIFDTIFTVEASSGSTGTRYLQDVISDQFKDLTPEQKNNVTVKTVPVTTENDVDFVVGTDETILSNAVTWDGNTLKVTGFDFNEHYATTANNDNAYELIVTVPGLVPKDTTTGDEVYSNNASASGIMQQEDADSDAILQALFPKPYISRHTYKLNVGDVNKDAMVNATFQLVDANGISVTSGLDDVIVQNGNNRSKFSTEPTVSWLNASTGQTLAFENLPAGAQVQTQMTVTDDSGTYTYTLETKQGETTVASNLGNTAFNLAYKDTNFNITSKVNDRTVTFKETVDGPYSSDADTFSPTIILVPPEGTPVPDSKTVATGVELVKDGEANRLKGTLSSVVGSGTDLRSLSLPNGWTLFIEQDNTGTVYEPASITYSVNGSSSQNYTETGIPITETTAITIHNVSKDIPVEGIFDSNHHTFIYILAGAGALALAAGGYYVWKKKDEFVEG